MKAKNKNKLNHDLRWIDVGRDPRARKQYLKEITRVVTLMNDLPRNAEQQYQLFSYLQIKDVMPESKVFFRKIVGTLLQSQHEIASRLISIEIHKNGTRRFDLETVISWIDTLALPYCKGVIHVVNVLDALQAKKIRVEKSKIFEYCKALCLVREYRAAGNLLLGRRLHMDDSVLTDNDMCRWSADSAQIDDHGIFRMWPILLCRMKRHAYVSARKIKILAQILCIACTERDDVDFTIKHMIDMSRESLKPRTYQRLLHEYRSTLRTRYREHVREMRARLRME